MADLYVPQRVHTIGSCDEDVDTDVSLSEYSDRYHFRKRKVLFGPLHALCETDEGLRVKAPMRRGRPEISFFLRYTGDGYRQNVACIQHHAHTMRDGSKHHKLCG